MKTTQLNHVALHVQDVDRSCQFYRDVLQLESLPRPAFSFPGAWFRLGADQELHLIGERDGPVDSQSRGNHYALMVDDIAAWEGHLQQNGVAYQPKQTRPDGAFQISCGTLTGIPSNFARRQASPADAARLVRPGCYGERLLELQLEDNVAVVVGGAQGIGRAIGEAFVRHGAHVALADIRSDVADTARELQSQQVQAQDRSQVTGHVVDATQERSVQRLAQDVLAARGRCDHIVYAAGAGSGKYGFPFWNLEPSDWEPVLRVNLLGAVHVTHAFRAALTEARRGTLLFLSSIAGQIGSQTDPPYSAAKAALINFAQCAAKDLAPYNVRVNSICPGMIRTEVNRSVWQAWHDQQPVDQRLSYDEWTAEKIARVTPLGRWQEPSDIADMAVFLASPRAHNITGQTINVDGGHVMHW